MNLHLLRVEKSPFFFLTSPPTKANNLGNRGLLRCWFMYFCIFEILKQARRPARWRRGRRESTLYDAIITIKTTLVEGNSTCIGRSSSSINLPRRPISPNWLRYRLYRTFTCRARIIIVHFQFRMINNYLNRNLIVPFEIYLFKKFNNLENVWCILLFVSSFQTKSDISNFY